MQSPHSASQVSRGLSSLLPFPFFLAVFKSNRSRLVRFYLVPVVRDAASIPMHLRMPFHSIMGRGS